MRAIYVSDDPDVLSVVLGTTSFTDLLDNLELLGRIGKQDERIAAQVKASRDGVADARRRTPAAHGPRRRASRRRVAVRDGRAARRRRRGSREPRRARRGAGETSHALASIEEDRDSTLAGDRGARGSRAPRSRRAIREAQRRRATPAIVAARRAAALLRWPVSGPGHERLRHALGAHARGHRHRGRLGHRRSAPRPPGR